MVDAVAVPAATVSDAEFDGWARAQRARAQRTKDGANHRFHEAELACWHRFAVNACISDARRARRGLLAEARTRELAVNTAERARRTQKRLDAIQNRQGADTGAVVAPAGS